MRACVGKCPTGLFIRAEERRFRVTASLSACRANDDSITQTSLGRSIAIIRRKSEERLAAGARKRMQIHTRACTHDVAVDTHARTRPPLSLSASLCAYLLFAHTEKRKWPIYMYIRTRMSYTLDVVTRERIEQRKSDG